MKGVLRLEPVNALCPQEIVLARLEGHAYERIAANLRIPVGTVRSGLYRAVKTLSAKIEEAAMRAA